MSALTALLAPPLAFSGRNWGGLGLLAIGVGLWIGWPLQARRQSEDIVRSHARLGYLIADVTIVAPLCLAAGYALVANDRWGSLVLLLAVGAGAYDLTHFLVYLGQRGVPRIGGRPLPWYAYGATIVAVLVFLGWLGWHEMHRLIHGSGPFGSGLWVTLPLVLAGAALAGALTWWLLRRVPPSGGSSPPGP